MALQPEIGVLDTSTFIWLDRLSDPVATLPAKVAVTSITLAELAVGPLLTDDLAERVIRQQHLQQAEHVQTLPFDAAAARAYAPVAASLRAAGHKRKARAYDGLIAATAIANGLPLYSGNPADFDGIAGLDLRPVPAPE
jgi:tRNA(fMet)-specific endonuclease VapC